MQPRKEHLPYHSEATVVRIFTEEIDGCRVAWLTRTTTRGKNSECALLTYLIVCDRKDELFPADLQTGIESGWVSPRWGQVHAGVRERTLRDGMGLREGSGTRERWGVVPACEHCREDNGGGPRTG